MKLIERGFIDAVNHVLAASPWATRRLAPFASSTVRVASSPVEFSFKLTDEGLFSAPDAERTADVTLAVPFGELPLVLTGGMNQLMTQVRIEGNAELADTLGFVFRNLRWDVEEDLARLVGDIPAHRIATSVSKLHQAQLRGGEAIAGNLREFLIDESGMLVSPNELAALRDAVTSLRDGVARMEKRINRLSRGTEPDSAARLQGSRKRK